MKNHNKIEKKVYADTHEQRTNTQNTAVLRRVFIITYHKLVESTTTGSAAEIELRLVPDAANRRSILCQRE